MLTNEQVLEWLKSLPSKADHYYSGTLDSKKEKSFGVYTLGGGRPNGMAIGGKATTKTAAHGVSILVHWNQSTRETQNAAIALYEALESLESVVIGGHPVNYIQMPYNEPISVGADEKGVCEYVIEFVVWYERG